MGGQDCEYSVESPIGKRQVFRVDGERGRSRWVLRARRIDTSVSPPRPPCFVYEIIVIIQLVTRLTLFTKGIRSSTYRCADPIIIAADATVFVPA